MYEARCDELPKLQQANDIKKIERTAGSMRIKKTLETKNAQIYNRLQNAAQGARLWRLTMET